MSDEMEIQQHEDPNANLIINYLPANMSEEQLRHIFSGYGEIASVKIVRDKATGRSLGYGFVKYVKGEDANLACQSMNGQQMENKKLKVAVSKPPGTERNCNLYVAGLEPHVNQEDLFNIFKAYGTVCETKILTGKELNEKNGTDKPADVSRGVGFVRYESSTDAQNAIKALNGITLTGSTKPLTVRVAEKKDNKSMPAPMNSRNMRFNPMGYYSPQNPQFQQYGGFGQGFPNQMYQQMPMSSHTQGFCLFIFNLPPESDESYLYQLFGPYGAVASVKIIRDPSTGLCKGFGFVNMMKLEDAHSAINSLNGAQIGTKTLQVSFKKDK